MTDDVNAKVVIDGTQASRSLLTLAKNVGDLRKTLEGLGIDMATVNRNLDNIEKNANNAARGINATANASKQAASAAKEEAAATDRMSKATQARTKAENDLARARKAQSNTTATKAWDQEFAALNKGIESVRSGNESIISQRYALYDVANTYRILGASLVGVGIYAGVMGAQFQTAFSNVKRTLDTDFAGGNKGLENVEKMRRSLVNLTSEIPLTFEALTQIATAGNEMGVPADKLVHFTEVVARFSAVAGISAEETSKAFGAIQAQTGLSTDYMENFGSAIAKVGIDSNASIPEILSLTREIARGGTAAGLTVDQIIGLSGTLASLRIPPERSRGSLTTYFETLNTAVAEGGEKLQNFSTITNIATEDLRQMVATGQGAEVLRAFLQGLGDTGNTVAATQALESLGLAQLRVSDTFRGLSTALDLYDRDQKNANSAFMQGSELQRQYAITLQNVSAQFQIFLNGINALAAAVSGESLAGLSGLLNLVSRIAFAFADWLGDNKWAAQILGFGVAVTTVSGFIFVLRGMIYGARAAVLAMSAAMLQAGGAGVGGAAGMRAFSGSAAGAAGSARAATGAVLGLRGALRALMSSTGIGLLITLGGTAIGTLADKFLGTDKASKSAALSMQQYNDAMRNTKAGAAQAADGADALTDSLGGGPGGGGGVAGAADAAAEKVRLLTDYLSDLQGVMKRSSDIRFGSQAAMDEITLKWITLNEKMDEYQRKVRTLTADKSLREYWLNIANVYDDQIRAAQLREEIAKIDDQLAEANAGASTELRGNSKAAIENRKTMRDLLGSYDSYIEALAAAGASQDEIQSVIRTLNADFASQGVQLGYNASDISTYGARFQDLTKIIDQVPRNITIDFNADPAQQALNEFFAKVEEQSKAAGSSAGSGFGDGFGGGIGGGDGIPINPEDFVDPSLFADSGAEAGKDWLDNFLEWATQWWGKFQETVTVVWEAGGVFFENMGAFFGGSVDNGFNRKTKEDDVIRGWTKAELDKMKADPTMAEVGKVAGKAAGDATKKMLGDTNAIGQWAAEQALSGNAWNSGAMVGNAMGNGATAAFSNAINGMFNSLNSIANVTKSTFSNLGGKGYSGGGYTGSGHWLEPAGIVHKGEYVVPKKHVDQRTGLPNMAYMNSLRGSKAAPARAGYAMGGFVGGGSNVMRLDAHSLQYLANAMSVKIGIGAKEISNASSRGDRANAWAGTN